MTNTPPPDPKSSQTNPLGFDEFIAILVAFATIGIILFWSFQRKDSHWNLSGLPTPTSGVGENQDTKSNLLSPSPTVTNQISINPQTTQIPSPALKIPNNTSTPVNQPITNQPLQVPTILPFGVVAPVPKMPAIPPAKSFTDVPSDYWARGFIDALSSRGIIQGFDDYSFRPNQPVTRAEFAAILEKSFAQNVANNNLTFKDVPANYWATKAIDNSVVSGFLKGYPGKSFQPEQKIPKVQVIVALVTGLNLKTPSSPNQILSIYKDAKDIPDYARDQVAAATENGIVVNYPDPTVLEPNKEATRAEVTAIIHQALVKMGTLPSIESKYVVNNRE